MSVDNCTMQINDYYTWCSAGKHNNGEICDAGVQSQHIVTMTMVCQGGNSPQPGIEAPVYGGPDGGGGSSSATPCSANGVYLQPQDPASSGCNAGVVTQPILEFNPTDNPCRKTNASISAANTVLKNPTVQSQMDAVLRGKATQPIEYAVAIGTNNGTYDVTAPNPGTASQSVTPVWNLANSSSFSCQWAFSCRHTGQSISRRSLQFS